jgi:UTP--glucose-1-phosphate uridylyltransferase
MIRKAVIPAAGLGTRFLPVTKSMPKEMLPKKTKGNKTYMIYTIVNQILKRWSRCLRQ